MVKGASKRRLSDYVRGSRGEDQAGRSRAARDAAGGEDLARSFYGDLLGLPETPKPPNLARRGGCWFESETVKIHLGVEEDFRPARKAHPALLVNDLRSLVAALSDAGMQIVEDEPLEGYRRVYTADPFGNRLELMEPQAD